MSSSERCTNSAPFAVARSLPPSLKSAVCKGRTVRCIGDTSHVHVRGQETFSVEHCHGPHSLQKLTARTCAQGGLSLEQICRRNLRKQRKKKQTIFAVFSRLQYLPAVVKEKRVRVKDLGL